MTAPKPRTLIHPDSALAIEVDLDHIDVYLSQGWVEQPPKKPSEKSDD